MKWGFAPPLRGPPLGAGPLDPPPMALRASGGAAAPAPPRGRVRIAGPRRPRTPRNNAGGCVPGPGAARAPPGPLGSSAALRRHQRYARRSRLSAGPFMRTPRPLLRRGPCPCAGRSGAARPAPLRGPGPAHGALASLAGPAPRGSPPAPSLGRLCAAARLRGRSLAPSGSRLRHPLRLRAPCSVALAPLRLRRAPARGPAGSPPPRPASRASGAAASGPGGPAAFGRGLGGCAPRGLAARPRLRGLAGASFVPLCSPWGSPLRPPAPPPPLGAPGSARPVAGLRPPSRLRRAGPPWGALLAPHS